MLTRIQKIYEQSARCSILAKQMSKVVVVNATVYICAILIAFIVELPTRMERYVRREFAIVTSKNFCMLLVVFVERSRQRTTNPSRRFTYKFCSGALSLVTNSNRRCTRGALITIVTSKPTTREPANTKTWQPAELHLYCWLPVEY